MSRIWLKIQLWLRSDDMPDLSEWRIPPFGKDEPFYVGPSADREAMRQDFRMWRRDMGKAYHRVRKEKGL